MTWRLSSFSTASAEVARDIASLGNAGVRSTRPAIRSAAAVTSAKRSTSGELDAENLVGPVAAWCGHGDGIADLLADQRLGERRRNGQLAALDVGLVHADDLVGGFLLGLLVHQPDMRAELDVLAGQRGRIDHLGRGNDLLQLRDASFDEGLPFA